MKTVPRNVEPKENFKNIAIIDMESIQPYKIKINESPVAGMYMKFYGYELTSENSGFVEDDTMIHLQLTIKEAIMFRDKISYIIEKILLKNMDKRGG